MTVFWILLTGSLVASCCGILGAFLVLRKMAMIGDAISHSVMPGIVIAFLLSGSRDSMLMLFAAMICGLLAVFLIQTFQQSGIQSDASIGVVFTALFALGVLLVSLFARQVHLDQDAILYGEIAYVHWNVWEVNGVNLGPKAVWLLGVTFIVIVAVIGLFYKQFKHLRFRSGAGRRVRHTGRTLSLLADGSRVYGDCQFIRKRRGHSCCRLAYYPGGHCLSAHRSVRPYDCAQCVSGHFQHFPGVRRGGRS